jgi:ankyrin repeat protein
MTTLVDDGDTLLHQSIECFAHSIFDYIIERADSVNIIDSFGRTPLHTAIDAANVYAAHCLLSRGADPNATDLGRSRPLNIATRYADVSLADLLLEHGAELNPPQVDARSPFFDACIRGNVAFAQFLLRKHCASPSDWSLFKSQHKDALHGALSNRHDSLAQWLLSLGYAPDSYDSYGNTPLHISVRNDLAQITLEMLPRVSSLSMHNRQNESLIH